MTQQLAFMAWISMHACKLINNTHPQGLKFNIYRTGPGQVSVLRSDDVQKHTLELLIGSKEMRLLNGLKIASKYVFPYNLIVTILTPRQGIVR